MLGLKLDIAEQASMDRVSKQSCEDVHIIFTAACPLCNLVQGAVRCSRKLLVGQEGRQVRRR